MKNYKMSLPCLLLVSLSLLISKPVWAKQENNKQNVKPRVTFVFTVHDLPKNVFDAATPYFTGGIKTMLDHGSNFNNCYQAHFLTVSNPGYSATTLGATPSVTGIVGNSWLLTNNPAMPTVSATATPGAFEFDPINPPKLLSSTLGSAQIISDSVGDELILNAPKGKRNLVFAIDSIQVAMQAGKLGKAFISLNGSELSGQTPQFNTIRGALTSSLGYFPALPDFVTAFNNGLTGTVPALTSTTSSLSWPLFFKKKDGSPDFDNPAYSFVDPYTYASPLAVPQIAGNENLYPAGVYFAYVPDRNRYVFDFAIEVLKQNLAPDVDQVIIFMSLSAEDPVAHVWGPKSYEAIDTLYHLDAQIKDLMQKITTVPGLNDNEVLWILNADSGICPLPEMQQEHGYSLACRINTNSPSALHAASVTPPATNPSFNPGNPSLNIPPTITYTPDPTFTKGSDSFIYQFADPCGNSNPATITIGIGSFAANNLGLYTCLNTLLSINVFNLPGTIATGTVTNLSVVSQPRNGAASVPVGSTTTINYTPNAGFTGNDTFTYRFTDATGVSNTGTIQVTTINKPFGGGGAARTCNGQPVVIPFSTLLPSTRAAFDANLGTTFVLPVTSINIVTQPQKGKLSLNLSNPSFGNQPTFTYTPNDATTTGVDSFSFTFVDACGTSDVGTITIALNGIPAAANYTTSTPAGVAKTILLSDITGTQFVTPVSVPAAVNVTVNGVSFPVGGAFPASLQTTINAAIAQQFPGIINIVKTISAGFIYLDVSKFPPTFVVPQNIVDAVKQVTLNYPGITDAWTLSELTASQTIGVELADGNAHPNQLVNIVKNSIYPNRSGQVLFNTICYDPFATPGTNHIWWNEYAAHSPLVFYQKGVTKHAVSDERVWNEQIAHTIAVQMGTQRPSTVQFEPISIPTCIRKKKK